MGLVWVSMGGMGVLGPPFFNHSIRFEFFIKKIVKSKGILHCEARMWTNLHEFFQHFLPFVEIIILDFFIKKNRQIEGKHC